jgi:hypothetical protein
MKAILLKSVALSVLIIGLGGYSQADTKVSNASKVKKEVKKVKNGVKKAKKNIKKKVDDTDLPIIKLKIDNSTPSNPKLKKGKGCEDLEEAKGKTFVDYPMAETIPCDKGGCKNLKPAKLGNYEYKDLPVAKTDGSCEE